MNVRILADIFSLDNTGFLLAGLRNTLLISLVTVALSVILGSILAICRNYGNRAARAVSAAYIEIFRNTPLLLWILVCIFMLHFGTSMSRGALALTLYTSSVIAEIMRGGLNSIAKGQFEAARSQGFNFLQTLWHIILPQ
ncbi:MAG: ABC transporter permease subunit, partial [Spirochaetaceae bacterium]|nr:ABC transporter permease subunit [Spirochaetaceae bacterium]